MRTSFASVARRGRFVRSVSVLTPHVSSRSIDEIVIGYHSTNAEFSTEHFEDLLWVKNCFGKFVSTHPNVFPLNVPYANSTSPPGGVGPSITVQESSVCSMSTTLGDGTVGQTSLSGNSGIGGAPSANCDTPFLRRNAMQAVGMCTSSSDSRYSSGPK